ncbi:hypothetical protein GCM10022291_26530 [Postechiella marina]|uniref:LamG-like jellyroll fold domain-containing protein n=1 Tax=Postechiella marina TaxID=943941 RepID=A0ABP8CDP5_9FLAO
MRFKAILFFTTVLTIKLFAQTPQFEPFFSEDLNALCEHVTHNLKSNNKDFVRGRVVDFILSADSTFTIKNNRRKSDLSVSFWFLPKKLDVHSGTLFGEENLFYFRYLSNRQLQFNYYLKKDVNTVSLLSDNIWQHIGFSIAQTGELKIYYNGDLVLKENMPSDWWKRKRAKFIVGNDRYGVKAEGSLDRLKIWNTVLPEAYFKKDYEASLLQTNLYHKLLAYLPLQGSLTDYSSSPKIIKLAKDVDFIKDSVKGFVANFKTEASFLRLDKLKFDNQITIASWVKPIVKPGVVGIAGNTDFSLRYKPTTQSMWFSVPMMFKIQSTQPKRDLNSWVHLAITVNYNHKVNFYINGELVDSKPVGGNTGKEDYIQIGKSLWGDTFNGQMSQFAIWSKVLSSKEIKTVYEGQLEVDKLSLNSSANSKWYVIYLVLLGLFLMAVFLFFRLKKKGKQVEVVSGFVPKEFPVKNAIFLFDKFRAFNKDGKDVSHEFTPTLVRLFSLILLFPRVTKRYISSAELSDILWETESVSQQKNNRGTNMHRLRKILKNFDGLSLNYQNRKWKFDIKDGVFVDTVFYNNHSINLVVNYPYKNLQLCRPLKDKNFDNIILQLNEQHLEKVRELCLTALNNKHWKILRKSARLWLSIDPLSEMALKYQITALLGLNEKQLALNRYKTFVLNYKETLNENLSVSFEDCMLN